MVKLSEARRNFLIRALLAVDAEQHNSPNYGDKLAGVYRVNAAPIWKMIEFFKAAGLIEYEYARIYTTREVLDVRLTERGLRIAARCLMWRYKDDLTAMPDPIVNRAQMRRP